MMIEDAIKTLVWFIAGISFFAGVSFISLWWQLRLREQERDRCES
jgi:hypothetical protein